MRSSSLLHPPTPRVCELYSSARSLLLEGRYTWNLGTVTATVFVNDVMPQWYGILIADNLVNCKGLSAECRLIQGCSVILT